MNYDLIILGGGPAGYLAAERAGHAGLKTLLIEKRALGGVCLNEGCIPSKSLLYSAKIFDYARFSEKYGVKTENAVLDHEVVVNRKNKVVKALVSGVSAAMKANHVTVVEANGFIEEKTPEGFKVSANDETYTGQYLLVCTGSVPVIPPIKGVKEGVENGFVLTNREILDLKEIPKNLVIIGGGVIGLEMASYFNSAGSNVTIIEMLGNIAGQNDIEICNNLMKNYEKKGISFKLNSKVVEITENAVAYEADGQLSSVVCDSPSDKVLLSIGRRPATQGVGLENIGVYVERGAVVTDRFSKTNIPNVYAAGDVNGKYMLAHAAYREAEVAINNILGQKDEMRYNAVPSVIYTNPEVGAVGETEATAKSKGLNYEVIKLSMRYSGRYVAENEGGDGICKLIIDKKTEKLLGCHMIGSYSSEIIVSAGLMIDRELRVNDIKKLIFPHPCVCEIIREGIFQYN